MEGCSYTSTPVLLNRMMEDNILVSSTISDTLIQRTFYLSIEQFIVFGQMYKEAIQEFRAGKVTSDTKKCDITIANNCGKFLELLEVGSGFIIILLVSVDMDKVYLFVILRQQNIAGCQGMKIQLKVSQIFNACSLSF